MSLLQDEHVDELSIHVCSRESPIAGGDDGLDGLLELIETHAGVLMPDAVSMGKKQPPYSRALIRKEFAGTKYPIRSAWPLRTKIPEASYILNFYEEGPTLFDVSIRVAPLDFFKEPAHMAERSQDVVALVRALASRYPLCWGGAHGLADELLGTATYKIADAPLERLDEVYWLNVLGKPLVDGLGRERVLSTPAAHLEELSNGSVLFLTRPTPADFDSEEARVAQARALVHLRPHLSYDAVLARLRERSAAFAPVARDWDPDIAPFLERTLKDFYVNKLNPRIAEYNKLRPPPPSEWLPLDSAPPSDVDDPAREIELYEGLFAERMVALFHEDVPEVMDDAPDSLPAADSYIWQRDFASYERTKVDGLLIPAVGAYLGKVLVYHLGGRWVPRRNLDEAQVVIGDRAWLPFLRARRNLQTRQTAFDYSLTQLYRAAERHKRQG